MRKIVVIALMVILTMASVFASEVALVVEDKGSTTKVISITDDLAVELLGDNLDKILSGEISVCKCGIKYIANGVESYYKGTLTVINNSADDITFTVVSDDGAVEGKHSTKRSALKF